MPHQLEALEIVFKSLFTFRSFSLYSTLSAVFGLTTHMNFSHGTKKEHTFNIRALLPKLSYLFLWHANKLTQGKIKRKSISCEFSLVPSLKNEKHYRSVLASTLRVQSEKSCKSFTLFFATPHRKQQNTTTSLISLNSKNYSTMNST